MHAHSILELLDTAAKCHPSNGLLISPLGDVHMHTRVTYRELRSQARLYSRRLLSIKGFEPRKPVLLYLDNNLETFIWFWAILYSNAVPVLTPAFSNIAEQRNKHIQGLADVLQHPICITKAALLGQFEGQESLTIRTIESLQSEGSTSIPELSNGYQDRQKDDDLAILMLTSGSTGTPKAVRLNHKQILSAAAAKVSFAARPANLERPFLNWIGLDHVACITEIHLTAMYLGVDQLHVYASDMISEPLEFLNLLREHKVSRSGSDQSPMAGLWRRSK